MTLYGNALDFSKWQNVIMNYEIKLTYLCLLRRRANARNVSYTLNLSGEKNMPYHCKPSVVYLLFFHRKPILHVCVFALPAALWHIANTFTKECTDQMKIDFNGSSKILLEINECTLVQ